MHGELVPTILVMWPICSPPQKQQTCCFVVVFVVCVYDVVAAIFDRLSIHAKEIATPPARRIQPRKRRTRHKGKIWAFSPVNRSMGSHKIGDQSGISVRAWL